MYMRTGKEIWQGGKRLRSVHIKPGEAFSHEWWWWWWVMSGTNEFFSSSGHCVSRRACQTLVWSFVSIFDRGDSDFVFGKIGVLDIFGFEIFQVHNKNINIQWFEYDYECVLLFDLLPPVDQGQSLWTTLDQFCQWETPGSPLVLIVNVYEYYVGYLFWPRWRFVAMQ